MDSPTYRVASVAAKGIPNSYQFSKVGNRSIDIQGGFYYQTTITLITPLALNSEDATRKT